MYRRLFGCSLLMLMWTVSASGANVLPWAPSASELALLPEYCKVRATDNQRSPEFKSWMQRIGPKFVDIHHYCAGLNFINRYQNLVSDRNRKFYLSRALSQIDYFAKDMPPDFPLAGDVYLNRGVALQLMGRDAAALTDFTKALERDPKQVRAYLEIASFHEKNRHKSKALDIVTTGLRQVPESKRLQRKYLSLGGEQPFQKAPLIEEDTVATELEKPNSEVSVDGTGEEGAVSKPSQNAESEGTGKGEEQKPRIGTPNNPYCRFCP